MRYPPAADKILSGRPQRHERDWRVTGTHKSCRVNQRGAIEHVEPSELTERATGMLESALAAGDSRGIAEAVVNLADALIKQAEADGSDGPIDRALDLLDANEQHFRTRDQQVRFLQRKGQALLLKAQRTADKSVMRAAVQVRKKRARLTPRGQQGYGEGMLELGITLLHSGAMFRNVAELDEAVTVLEAAEKHPDGSADRSLVLTSLGNARLERLLRSAGRSQAELDAVDSGPYGGDARALARRPERARHRVGLRFGPLPRV